MNCGWKLICFVSRLAPFRGMNMTDETVFDNSRSAPCPWCQTNKHLQMVAFGLSQFAVRCGQCRVAGPVGITSEVAAEDWNKLRLDKGSSRTLIERLYHDGLQKLSEEIHCLQGRVSPETMGLLSAYRAAFAFLTGTAVGGSEYNLLLGKYASDGEGLHADTLKSGVFYRCLSDKSGVLSKGDLVAREGDRVVLFHDDCRDAVKSNFPIGQLADCRFALDSFYYRTVVDSYEPVVRKAKELLESYGCCDWYMSHE